MKFSRLALLVGLTMSAVTHAEITLSPMAGYTFFDQGDQEFVELDDAATYSFALGYRVNPKVGLELRYGFAKPDAKGLLQDESYSNHQLTADAYYRFNPQGKVQPFVLTGFGVNSLRGGNTDTMVPMPTIDDDYNHLIANVGTGAFVQLNDDWSLRGELRAVADLKRNAVDAFAGLGLTYAFNKEKPVVDVDDDQDGVVNRLDECPNTISNLMVDAKGCPLTTVEYLTKRMNVFFETDQSDVKEQYLPEIQQLAKLLNQHPDSTVEIQGHTDDVGSDNYNLKLSERRAKTIADILVQNFGIQPQRVSWQGYGETKPVANNDTAEGRALNRRSTAKTTIRVRVAVVKPQTNNVN